MIKIKSTDHVLFFKLGRILGPITLILVMLSGSTNLLQAQIDLGVAIAGINHDPPDGFALVALEDIDANDAQKIFFTDMGYEAASNIFDGPDGSGNPSPNEGAVQITWSGIWSKGTIIRVVETGTSVFTVTTSANGPAGAGASIVYAGDGFSLSNEGLSVFSSSNTTDPAININKIYCFVQLQTCNGGPLTCNDVDPGLDSDCPCADSFSSIYFTGSDDYVNYKDAERANTFTPGTFAIAANWDRSSTAGVLSLVEYTDIDIPLPLPIELLSFQAEAFESKVMTNWITASEENNNFFSIEHSQDGLRFNTIGIVDGAGFSTGNLNYSYVHDTPSRGINYYRVRQTDYNGQSSLSPIQSVNMRNEFNEVSILSPNPFRDEITVEIPKAFESNLKIEIYNYIGELVATDIMEKDQVRKTIDLSNLEDGSYFMEVGNGEKMIILKIAGY